MSSILASSSLSLNAKVRFQSIFFFFCFPRFDRLFTFVLVELICFFVEFLGSRVLYFDLNLKLGFWSVLLDFWCLGGSIGRDWLPKCRKRISWSLDLGCLMGRTSVPFGIHLLPQLLCLKSGLSLIGLEVVFLS